MSSTGMLNPGKAITTVVCQDDATGHISGFHCKLRSEIPAKMHAHILQMRKDPELNCPSWCRDLIVDPAGEWHRDNTAFMSLMAELNVDVDNPPSQDDKRLVGRAELVVKLTIRNAIPLGVQ